MAVFRIKDPIQGHEEPTTEFGGRLVVEPTDGLIVDLSHARAHDQRAGSSERTRGRPLLAGGVFGGQGAGQDDEFLFEGCGLQLLDTFIHGNVLVSQGATQKSKRLRGARAICYHKPMDPTQDLLIACANLDPEGAKLALDRGADIQIRDEDSCPATIVVLRAPSENDDHLARRQTLIKLLFGAGAELNPDWAQDVDVGTTPGIEILLDQVLDRIERDDWNHAGEVALLDAWFAAGNDPDPRVTIDGKLRTLPWMLCFSLSEMEEWTLDGDKPWQDKAWAFAREMVVTMGLHGAAIQALSLENAGFDEAMARRTLDQLDAAIEQQQLENSTPGIETRKTNTRVRL